MYVVAVEGLESIDDLNNVSDKVLQSARRAIEKATARARTESSKMIRDDTRFPAQYLTGGGSSARLAKRIVPGGMAGQVIGRQRATSLARFGVSNLSGRPNTGAAKFRVKAFGAAKPIPRAFLMKMQGGNVGIAYRVKPGQAHAPGKKSSKSVFIHRKKDGRHEALDILYGPSVDQVFRRVAEDVKPLALSVMEAEFQRLMGMKT